MTEENRGKTGTSTGRSGGSLLSDRPVRANIPLGDKCRRSRKIPKRLKNLKQSCSSAVWSTFHDGNSDGTKWARSRWHTERLDFSQISSLSQFFLSSCFIISWKSSICYLLFPNCYISVICRHRAPGSNLRHVKVFVPLDVCYLAKGHQAEMTPSFPFPRPARVTSLSTLSLSAFALSASSPPVAPMMCRWRGTWKTITFWSNFYFILQAFLRPPV